MNSIYATIVFAIEFALSTGATTQPVVEYIPAGQPAYLQNCLALASINSVVMYCQSDNKIIVMSTNQ